MRSLLMFLVTSAAMACAAPGGELEAGMVTAGEAGAADELIARSDIALELGLPGTLVLLDTLVNRVAPVPAGRPGALAYLPRQLDDATSLDVVVYLHGHRNCVENIVRPRGAARACTSGGPPREAYDLLRQFDAARKNALFLAPEMVFDAASSRSGMLGLPGGLRAFLSESLGRLAGPLAGRGLESLGRVLVVSHSGGYHTAALMAAHGGLPIAEIHLLDSLYGDFAEYDAWIDANRAGLAAQPRSRRFTCIYTDLGGTMANSLAMHHRVRPWFPAGGGVVLNDETLGDEGLGDGAALVFKHSGLAHDDVPRSYFRKLLEQSSLVDLP